MGMAYNTSMDNIYEHRGWLSTNSISLFNRVNSLLTALLQNIPGGAIPPDVQQASDHFKTVPKEFIDNQRIINEAITNAAKLADQTNTSGVVTHEDYKKMRGYIVSLTRAAYRQNEIQINTTDDRKKVIHYLDSNIKFSFSNIKRWQKLQQLKRLDAGMLSKENRNEVRDLENMRNDLFQYDFVSPEKYKRSLELFYAKTRNPHRQKDER